MSADLVAVGMVAVGLQLSLQAPLNGALARRTGSIAAALVSFLVGLVLIGLLLLATGDASGLAELGRIEPYELFGGLCGAAYVAAATFAIGKVGAGAIAAATVAGQLTSGIVIDHAGWFGLEPEAAGPLRLLAVPVLVFGALLVSGDRRGAGRIGLGTISPVPLGLVFLAGLAIGIQHPLNSSLADVVGDLGAAELNFAVGTVALGLALLLTGGLGRIRNAPGAPPWAFAGGVIGAVTVIASLAAVSSIGASVLAATTIAGALLGSVLVDRYGIAGVAVRPLDRIRILGLFLLALGTLAVL
ncbi:MAG: DMT family transporter [Solirubrobacterales bacterium]